MNKPLISFLLLTYNQENYIQDAINGALAQTYSPLEIIISDDCSTDGTYKKIEEIVADYSGPHKIVLNKNPKNLGIAQHFNVVCEMAKGEILMAAAGDDVSLPNRAMRTYEILNDYPTAVAVSFQSIICDEKLNYSKDSFKSSSNRSVSCFNINDYLEFQDFLIFSGDSRAIKREVFDFFGSIQYGKDEDSTYFIRSLIYGNICYARESQVLRRWHGMNASDFNNIKRINFDDIAKQPFLDIDLALSKSVLSKEEAENLRRKIKSIYRILLDQYYCKKSKWYKFLFIYPNNYLRRLKNKLFN